MNSFLKAALIQPVRKLLGLFGLKVTRLTHAPSVEDLIFQSFGNAKDVHFIQVGAHDGSHNDPISRFRDQPNWYGLLLEPNARVYSRLVETISSSPRCHALNVAISETGGSSPFYVVRDPENCRGGQFSDQVSSFDRDHVEKMVISFGYSKEEAAGWIEETKVESVTFADLLNRAGNHDLDLLFIDAEGADFRLLKTFPFARHRPLMLVFEFSHLNNEELHEILPFLSMHGYSFSVIGEDIVAVRWPY